MRNVTRGSESREEVMLCFVGQQVVASHEGEVNNIRFITVQITKAASFTLCYLRYRHKIPTH